MLEDVNSDFQTNKKGRPMAALFLNVKDSLTALPHE